MSPGNPAICASNHSHVIIRKPATPDELSQVTLAIKRQIESPTGTPSAIDSIFSRHFLYASATPIILSAVACFSRLSIQVFISPLDRVIPLFHWHPVYFYFSHHITQGLGTPYEKNTNKIIPALQLILIASDPLRFQKPLPGIVPECISSHFGGIGQFFYVIRNFCTLDDCTIMHAQSFSRHSSLNHGCYTFGQSPDIVED